MAMGRFERSQIWIQLISCNARAKLYSDKAKSKSNLLSLGLQLPSGHCMASLSLSKLEQLRLHQRRQWSLRFCWTPYLFAANGTVLGSYTRSNWSGAEWSGVASDAMGRKGAFFVCCAPNP
ncbi:uncharacterized protein [Malus domestica]|uniref:uncharacterized protein isoform X2 n=1 Tax=Malus domestica TaxID=3750 RepID=UPI00397579A6